MNAMSPKPITLEAIQWTVHGEGTRQQRLRFSFVNDDFFGNVFRHSWQDNDLILTQVTNLTRCHGQATVINQSNREGGRRRVCALSLNISMLTDQSIPDRARTMSITTLEQTPEGYIITVKGLKTQLLGEAATRLPEPELDLTPEPQTVDLRARMKDALALVNQLVGEIPNCSLALIDNKVSASIKVTKLVETFDQEDL